MATKKEKAVATEIENKFSKEQLLSADRFQGRRDIVNALLSPDKQYTVEAVEEMIKKYYEREVH